MDAVFGIGFREIANGHFNWIAEVSTDGGRTWERVEVIEAERIR